MPEDLETYRDAYTKQETMPLAFRGMDRLPRFCKFLMMYSCADQGFLLLG